MIRQILTYCAAFLTGFIVWMAINVILALHPSLPWAYPWLAPVLGMTFPGGAPVWMHFASHIARSWSPFLAAWLVARALNRGRARFSGAVLIYLAFVLWSGVLVLLHGFGLGLGLLTNLGLVGTFLGGLGLYLWRVAPARAG